jgi:Protein of unknown function, DUF481
MMSPRRRRDLRSVASLWFTIWILCLPHCLAAAEAWVVFLKNGDRLTGELVSRNDKRVVIKSAIAGRVTIARGEIDRLVPVSELNRPNISQTSPTTSAAPPALPPASAPAAAAVKPAPAPALTTSVTTNNSPPQDPFIPGWITGIATNWHGNFQAGLNLGLGTTDRTTFYANGSAAKKWGRTVSTLTYSAAYGEVNGVQNANMMAGTAKVDVEISPNRRTYAYGQGAGGYDAIRKIDLEYLGGGGLGYRLIDRPKRVLAAELGFQYQSFDYSTSDDLSSVAVRFGQNLTTTVEKLTISQRFGFTPSVEDFSNYQVNFFLTFSYPLFKPLTLNLNLVDQYLSKPAAGVQNNDLQIQTTIGITF